MVEIKEKIIFPECMERYMKENEIVFLLIPLEYKNVKFITNKSKRLKSIKQLITYIENEIEFWNYDEIRNNHIVQNYKINYEKALKEINEAALLDNELVITNKLKSAIKLIVDNCKIGSSTPLAKEIKKHKDKTNYFFRGFESALKNVTGNNYYNYDGWFQGFYYGMVFVSGHNYIDAIIEDYKESVIENVNKSEEMLSDIVGKYTTLILQNEEDIKIIRTNLENDIANQKKLYEDFIRSKSIVLEELERTYESKLRLSKPAEYWKEMSINYKKSGIGWLIASGIVSISIITILVLIIILTPNIFDSNGYWLDMLKNTALLTVITSIMIYVLRVLIKMTMSSFHLSRDAKEREQLSYFYLSLIHDSAVSDNERALIINSLFSRSDTGLLKGDSAPSMSANITDLVEKDKSK